MSINFDKISKYSIAGPRYTSYPTALEFNSHFKYQEYLQFLRRDKNKLSIYIHLPFCRTVCYFCGCSVIFTSKNAKLSRYIEYLKKEIDILSNIIDTNRELIQFHFGGGTPTYYKDFELDEIMNYLKSKFKNFSPNAEISCEIDPRYFNEGHIKVFKKHNFNRLSFGIQDFNNRVQKEINRIQPFDLTEKAVKLARKYNINSINIDLIYGLPYQTLKTFQKTLDLAYRLSPDRIALFNYAHVPWLKKSMRKFDETTLPTSSEKLSIFKYSIDFFTSKGYRMIGLDHFSKPEDELFLSLDKGELHRNFQGYTTKKSANLIGIGLTSIGEGDTHYAQNFKDINYYEKAIDSGILPFERGVALNQDDLIRQSVIMKLMANFIVDIKEIENLYNINFREYFKESLINLEQFIRDDLLVISEDKIKVNKTGILLIRNIAMQFDAYIKKYKNSKNNFSKTI